MTEVHEQRSLDGRRAESERDDRLHAEAVQRLEKKREFRIHLSVFVVINALLWLVWGLVYAYTGFTFPWPLFPLAGWGIGLGFHAYDVYYRRPFTEAQIDREAARLRAAR
ncbi:MAG TPA: 2TM domain-containing protein [Gaiellaceae bacterium]|jgi:hypothetical protein|nr:2TM domain-containing protein [Gaiellaceae bacterium]